jgi:hypothetical protein
MGSQKNVSQRAPLKEHLSGAIAPSRISDALRGKHVREKRSDIGQGGLFSFLFGPGGFDFCLALSHK